jgi:hypothetical protein
MTALLKRVAGQGLMRAGCLRDAWDQFWFTPADVAALAAIRVCTGLVLFYTYATIAPDVLNYLGPHAWVDSATVDQFRRPAGPGEAPAPAWWGQSVWFYLDSPSAVVLIYAAFLAAIVCFTLGLFTRLANVAVWAGHLSFIHRAFVGWCGMDTVLAMLTFYLLFAPSGAAFSLDRRRSRAAVPQSSWSANVALRLIQLHICVIYLCAGLSKLRGNRWWDGTAVWLTMNLHEYALLDFTWLGHFGDDVCLLLSNVGVLATLGFEIGFTFLVWNSKARPALLWLAVFLHAGIGLFMGMGAFGAAMLTGCVAFVDPSQIRTIVSRWAPRFAGRGKQALATRSKRAA